MAKAAKKPPAPPAITPESPDQAQRRIEREAPHLEAYQARRKAARPVPDVIATFNDGVNALALDHPDQKQAWHLTSNAIGTGNPNFTNILIGQLADLSGINGRVDTEAMNGALAIISGVQPSDEVEAMLAAQMAAIHTATMTAARRLKGIETLQQLEANTRAVNQLARTFTAQVETLKRYRSKGEQRVVVQHQHVNVTAENAAVQVNAGPGGGGGVAGNQEGRPYEPRQLEHAVGATLWGAEPTGEPVPVPGHAGKGTL